MKKMFWLPVFGVLFVLTRSAAADTYYVDDVAGDDASVGTSEQTAWRTLDRVNAAAVGPGDRVLFRRGGLWRGQLRPKSGLPGNRLVYSWYGKGPKPILENAVERSKPSDWIEEAPGIWATRKCEPKLFEIFWQDSSCQGWGSSFQDGVKGSLTRVTEKEETFLRVTCLQQLKKKRHMIQLWGPEVKNVPDCAVLKMKVRSSKPFVLKSLGLSLDRAPWTTGLNGAVKDGTVGPAWKTITVLLTKGEAPEKQVFHFSLGDVLPEGAVFDFAPISLQRATIDPSLRLPYDVGIFICNHGEKWGVKKWRLEDVKAPLDYWDDRASRRVFVRADANPATLFKSIELALTSHVINEGGCHDVTYDGLTVRYTGAHGFGGGSTVNITIRNCDVYWIGGGLQFWRKNADGSRHPVRFGNGIEFWAGAVGHLVERNRLWQIYDAALTNQTNGDPNPERDIVWRDNVIWQAEYSFEYWNHDRRSFTDNITFEHNTCIDAGYCWSHDQRPDPNGAHLMFYDNAAPTTNFVVRNNLFVRTTDRSTRMFNDWRKALKMERNLYWIPSGKIYEYHVNGRDRKADPGTKAKCFGAGADAFARYQAETGMDAGSVYGAPQFVDEARRDYRLKPGTFGSDLATDGGPLGARNMPGLDGDPSLSERGRSE